MEDTRIHILSSRSVKLLLLLLLAGGRIIAQPRLEQAEMFVGVYGGATASTVFFTPKVDGMDDLLKSPIGWGAGAVFRFGAHKVCSFQVEAGYAQYGWREYDKDGNFDYRRKLHYIQVPLLAHIHFGGEHAQGFVNLGPQVGYCFNNAEWSGTKQTTSTYQYRPIDHLFDWGATGGVGFYGMHRKAGVFQLELRVYYSFGSLYNTSRAEHFAASNMLTACLNFAYMWQIK